MPSHQIAALAARLSGRVGSGFPGVWPDNRLVVDAFLVASTQWRTTVEADKGRFRTVFVGLDYAGARVAWEACGFPIDAQVFGGVAAMELSARAALNGGQA